MSNYLSKQIYETKQNKEINHTKPNRDDVILNTKTENKNTCCRPEGVLIIYEILKHFTLEFFF